MFCQRVVKGSVGIFLNPFNHTTKLGIRVRIINICNGDSDTRIMLDILVFLSIGGVRELDILAIS